MLKRLVLLPVLSVGASVVCSAAEPMEEVTVVARPIQASQAAAIEAKRMAENVMDVISADTIGRFPDQNLADSLGRVPGLAIERDQGQARFINFRGAPFRYTAIAFDGIDVPGAENGRIPRFDAFPAVITSRIDVNKAITADMPGEAVSGFVDVRTFDPFSFAGLRLSAEAGLGTQELGDQDIDKYNFRASWSNDTFGFVGFASNNKRGRITDNRELELEQTANGIIPNNLDFRSYRGYREDNAWGGTIEGRLGEGTRVFFSTLYSEFVDVEERNQWDFELADGAAASGVPLTPTTGYAPVVIVTRLLEDGEYSNSTFTNTLGFDFEAAGWDLALRLNYAETKNDTFLPIPYSTGATIAAAYDITNVEVPILEAFATGTMNPTDVNELSYPANFAIVFVGNLDTDALKYKADLSRDMTVMDRPTKVKLGIQYDTREASGTSTQSFGAFPGSVNISDYVTSTLWDTGFVNSVAGRNHDNIGIRQAWTAAAGGNLAPTPDASSLVGIDEDILALYLMATTSFDWGSVTYGARFESTDYVSTGSLVSGGSVQPVSLGDSYTNILPSLHINVNLTEDVTLRLSGSTGLSRPTYSELRASASVDVINLEIDGGNPLLKPEEAWGGDLSLEYYFAPASIISGGVFFRNIDNVIYADGVTIADGSVYAPGLIAAGTATTFNSFFNGTDGKLTGVEVNLVTQLPGPLADFGFSGNVTLLDSEFVATTLGNRSFSLPGTSDLIYNASVYFEKWGVSARLNYQYRDDWLSTTENDNLSEFWAEESRVDLSVRYVLPLNSFDGVVTLFANANNLADSIDVRYSDSPRTPNQVEGFGRRWLVGVRVDY